jgi:hypothetical protein
MSRHRYRWRGLAPDYARAGIGGLFTVGPLLFTRPASVMLWLLIISAAMFLVFGLQTALRQATVLELTASGICARGPLGAAIKWEELRDVDVRYYSTRRDRSHGWMQVTLRGNSRRVRFDSSITDFTQVVRAAVAAAAARNVPISPSSLGNLRALGIQPGGDPTVSDRMPGKNRK